MIEPDRSETLIRRLADELPPVRRLPKPWIRALLWLSASAFIVVCILALNGSGLLMSKLSHGPDEVLEFVGAALTAVLAACAAFTLAIPGRPAAWALLPLPSLMLWLAGSGWGCWRIETVAEDPAMHPPLTCFRFILLISVPLSLLLFVMLRRSFSVRPGLTATLAGLAAAAAAATLLDFVHPFEVTVPDLAAHAAAVIAVVSLNRLVSGRALGRVGVVLSGLVVTHGAMAQTATRPIVIELYTSQGCSSCPPADALLSEYARGRPDLLPLAFHVEYWNRLGWTDPFSAPSYTARERLHAARLGEDTVYTPEVVVEGVRAVVGSDRDEVERAIRAAKARAMTLATVAVRRAGPGEITIAIGPGVGAADVLVIGFDGMHTTSIGRGENGGRTLTESNIVRSMQTVARWVGAPVEQRLVAPLGERVAVLLEAPDGRVVGAAALP